MRHLSALNCIRSGRFFRRPEQLPNQMIQTAYSQVVRQYENLKYTLPNEFTGILVDKLKLC